MAKARKTDLRKINLKLMTRLGFGLRNSLKNVFKITNNLLDSENPRKIKNLQLELLDLIEGTLDDLGEAESLLLYSELLRNYLNTNFRMEKCQEDLEKNEEIEAEEYDEEAAYLKYNDIFSCGADVIFNYHRKFLSDYRPPIDICDEKLICKVREASYNLVGIADLFSECAAYYYKQDEDEKVNRVLAESLNTKKFSSIKESNKRAFSNYSGTKALAVYEDKLPSRTSRDK